LSKFTFWAPSAKSSIKKEQIIAAHRQSERYLAKNLPLCEAIFEKILKSPNQLFDAG
jgi:hypothetical protein